jgi:hypothetical protein
MPSITRDACTRHLSQGKEASKQNVPCRQENLLKRKIRSVEQQKRPARLIRWASNSSTLAEASSTKNQKAPSPEKKTLKRKPMTTLHPQSSQIRIYFLPRLFNLRLTLRSLERASALLCVIRRLFPVMVRPKRERREPRRRAFAPAAGRGNARTANWIPRDCHSSSARFPASITGLPFSQYFAPSTVRHSAAPEASLRRRCFLCATSADISFRARRRRQLCASEME